MFPAFVQRLRPVDTRSALLHVDPQIAKRLKLLAVEHDTTIEALGLLLERYGQQGGTR